MRIKARTWKALTSAERMGALQNAVDRTKCRWQKKKSTAATVD